MKQLSHFIEYALFTLFRGFLHLLPFAAVQRTGRLLGGAFCRLLPGRRATAMENLRRAFPGRPDAELRRIVKGAFENLGISICELLCFDRLDRARLGMLLHGGANSAGIRALNSKQGRVILTGHYGNWELVAYGVAPLAGDPFLLVVKTQSNRLVDAVINRLRCGLGNSVVTMERSVRGALAKLQGGGTVALAADQSAPRESDFVPFFGREVATFRGPAVFALRTGMPMVMVFTVRRPDYTYDVFVEEVPTGDLLGASEENVRELTRRHVAVLERHIRLHPDHWLWMHRRWKHVHEEHAGEGEGVAAS